MDGAQREKRDQADLEGRLEIYRRLKSKKLNTASTIYLPPLGTREIAFSGHTASQRPQPKHRDGSIVETAFPSRSVILRALKWHTFKQSPAPLQTSLSVRGIKAPFLMTVVDPPMASLARKGAQVADEQWQIPASPPMIP